jgi:hypothetical protein
VVLLTLGEHRPVIAHPEALDFRALWHLSGAERVEDEDAAGDERLVNAPEDAAQATLLVLGVEEVVEDLADRRDGAATRDLDLEERAHPKLGLGRSFARDLDHRFRDVHAEDAVPGVDQLPRK